MMSIKGADVAGSFVWSFDDWRGDRPMLTVQSNTPDLYTQGIVEFNREKKVSYDVVRSMFFGEKIAALPVGTHSVPSPVSYVLLGLLLLILFFWLLNTDRRFRESVFRALRRPYNFYADIRDQRILSNLHTAILSAIVAVTFAIVVSSVLYHFRSSAILDYILTMVMTSDSLKAVVIELVWHPIECIAYGGLACFAWMFIVTVLVQLFSFFVRTKVYLFHSVLGCSMVDASDGNFYPVGDDFISRDGKRDVRYSRSCDFRDGHDLDSLQDAERNLDHLRQLFR